jgi:hypothetical protein
MQRASICSLFLFLLLIISSQAYAQEAFAPEQLYFQGEVIQKVSIGSDGIWVIKGEDSTGLAKLDFQGQSTELASSLNLTHPLTHISWVDMEVTPYLLPINICCTQFPMET